MLRDSYDLGEFITVLNDEPIKYQVRADNHEADSRDPMNQIPFYIVFTRSSIGDVGLANFVVKISSDLRDFYFANRQNDMFFNAVKFGLLSLKEKPEQQEFDFFTHEYEHLRATVIPAGLRVRFEILKFVNTVNSKNPSWEINEFQLRTNINTSEDQIRQWTEDLERSEYFLSTRKSTPDIIYGGSIILPHYSINPKMRAQAEVELKQAIDSTNDNREGLEIFISYSHRDKVLAGELDSILKDRGFRTFLAHNHIEVSKDWRLEILKHLLSCQIFVAVITSSFNDSDWTHQEVGHSLGLDKMIISLMRGGRLKGFLESRQALMVEKDDAKAIVEKILDCIKEKPEFKQYL